MITVLWQVDAVFSLTCDLIDVCLICTFSLGIRSGNPYFLFQSSNRSHLDLIVMYISKHCYFPFICVKCVLHLLLFFFFIHLPSTFSWFFLYCHPIYATSFTSTFYSMHYSFHALLLLSKILHLRLLISSRNFDLMLFEL